MQIRSGPNAATTDYDVCVKAIIIGDSGVGKSSLLYRFSDQDWNPHYIATIGVDFKVMTFERGSKVVKLQLWDTAGQERFRTITHSYYRGAHGIMLVFDVTNAESFDNIATWMKDVNRFSIDNAPMVLVGNKTDCANKRVVSREAGEALAAQLGCFYTETSAKDNCKVEEAFTHLVDDCVTKKAKSAPPKPSVKPPVKLPFGSFQKTHQTTKDETCAC
jgi:Ras-related protein Rab-1A